VHGYPKVPSQLSPVLRNSHIHYNNEASGMEPFTNVLTNQAPFILGHQHQDRRHIPLSNAPERRHAPVQNYHNGGDRRHMPNLGDRRHISPPLHINICDNSTNIISNSPPDVMHQRNMMDFSNSQRRHGREVRVSPVHFQQHSPQFYRQAGEESIKSESPSRKRRRLSRSGHHIELNAQPASPPRRSPRQHPPSTSHHNMQGSPPLRRPRYRDRNDFIHGHHQTFLPSPPPVAHAHPHQSTVMMDINQVCDFGGLKVTHIVCIVRFIFPGTGDNSNESRGDVELHLSSAHIVMYGSAGCSPAHAQLSHAQHVSSAPPARTPTVSRLSSTSGLRRFSHPFECPFRL
jgi:hypothetical protein